MKAIRAKSGKLTKVAAIKASDVLQSVRTMAMAIMAMVDSVGFNDKTEINGYRHTDALHIVERFRRPDANTLQYEATLEDPNVFVKPWTVNRSFALRPDLSKVDEFVCEHNTDYTKFFEKK